MTTGDLVSELYVTVSAGNRQADIGGLLTVNENELVTVEIRFKDPVTPNASGINPAVERVDLIIGEVSGRHDDLNADSSPSTRVFRRFTAWSSEGGFQVMSYSFKMTKPFYVRVRGASDKDELEPLPDEAGEDPWNDLWFYSNPVFVNVNSGYSTSGRVYLQTTSTSQNVSARNLVNTSDVEQKLTGTLYGSDGAQVRLANQPLHSGTIPTKVE